MRGAEILTMLAELRAAHSSQELAYILGCSESTLSGWLNKNKKRLPSPAYRRIIEGLHRKEVKK